MSKHHIHFISIGGAAMHNLALELARQGYEVSGSDDEIYEPSRSRLAAAGILPNEIGWFPEKLRPDTHAVILGMHARANNPELLQAKMLGLKVYSYPEFIYSKSQHKHRVVIAGSHGKTTTTAMILHVLRYLGREFDYLVGAKIEGFDLMARLSNDAPLIVIEGDEYLASPVDRVPKFMHYHHHIALITGIAWDHINVFPTFDNYTEQFEKLANLTPKAGYLIYDDTDTLLAEICQKPRQDTHLVAYEAHEHTIREGQTYLITRQGKEVPISVFGTHNLKNIAGAKQVLNLLGVEDEAFYEAIGSFAGAAKRLEKIGENADTVIFRDFAHAPSKVVATQEAVKTQFPHRKLVACLELHTFSSLNKDFLGEYANKLNSPDVAIVYFNPDTLKHKKLAPIDPSEVVAVFKNTHLLVFTDSAALEHFLVSQNWAQANLLLMSSGTFGSLDLSLLTQKILQ